MVGSANGADMKACNGGRLFVLMLFLEDDTITIREPPLRNSGHIGGNFLCRSRVKKDEKNYYTPQDAPPENPFYMLKNIARGQQPLPGLD